MEGAAAASLTWPKETICTHVPHSGLALIPRLPIIAANGTTVLAAARLFGAQYPFIVLTGLPPNTPVFAEVTHVVSTANGGIYALSAGGQLASDEPLRALFLWIVSR